MHVIVLSELICQAREARYNLLEPRGKLEERAFKIKAQKLRLTEKGMSAILQTVT